MRSAEEIARAYLPTHPHLAGAGTAIARAALLEALNASKDLARAHARDCECRSANGCGGDIAVEIDCLIDEID
jgi:hypothetical protein